NAGASWDTIRTSFSDTSRQFFPVDSIRWCFGGTYTTNAGSTWQRIPGWDSTLNLIVFDSNSAFGQNRYGNWRLDMPWYVKPLKTVESPQIDRFTNIVSSFAFSQNPFSRQTDLRFELSDLAYVEIAVYN